MTRWPGARKLLAIRLDASGDVLMCTPALHALADAGFRVSLLTSASGALVGSRLDGIDSLIVFEAPWMKASAASDRTLTLTVAERLRTQGFDGCIILHSYSQSPLPAAMLCHLAGIPRQLAYCRENPYHLISDWLPEPEPGSLIRHEVQRQLDLVRALGAVAPAPVLRMRVSADDDQAALAALARAGLADGEAFLLLHPGATAATRRYPLSSWIAVGKQLRAACDLPLVLAGGSEDRPALQALSKELSQAPGTQRARVIDALDIGGLAALIWRARLLMANNSAPAHLAAAMGTPVVVLYASTNPQHTPWTAQSRVLTHAVPCAPCYRSVCPQRHHACMTGIAASQVIKAVKDLLRATEK